MIEKVQHLTENIQHTHIYCNTQICI